MPSRADSRTASPAPVASSLEGVLRIAGAALHMAGLIAMALLLWRFITPERARRDAVRVGISGRLDASLSALVRSASDTIDVQLESAPDARARAALRALRGSGRAVRVTSDRVLNPVAVSVDEEWRALGGTRVQTVAADSTAVLIADAAGTIDSTTLSLGGTQSRTGPVQGTLRVSSRMARAMVAPLFARAPQEARVLVLGEATWESRFLVAALEESGWTLDVAVSLSPKVTVTQGPARVLSSQRHSIVVVLPGTPPSAIAALPGFVRNGGGLVIIGAAARSAGLASLLAGSPGATTEGEVGAESGTDARHGLDLVPVTALAEGGVALERRDGNVAVAARRVGAGRVVQVGYENSWLWRMAGNDDAPAAHRRWWNTILSGVVPLSAPISRVQLDAEHDTVDAAPVAALARDLDVPVVRASRVTTISRSLVASLDPRWLLALAVLSLVASWTLRRWRGLA